MQFVAATVQENDEDVAVGEHLRRQSEIQINRRQYNEVERLEDNQVNTCQSVAEDRVEAVVPLSNQANAFEDS